jgi:hypothetical protein
MMIEPRDGELWTVDAQRRKCPEPLTDRETDHDSATVRSVSARPG